MIAARSAQSPEYYLTPDCPTDDGQIDARWGGKASKLMGLMNTAANVQWRDVAEPSRDGGIDAPASSFGVLSFLRLAKGLNPDTGGKLTARLKADRRDAIDVTMTVPKELSIIIEVGGDERAKAALWEANDYAMRLWEKEAKVRVRKGGANYDRETGNMVWASFYHGTTRPISEPVASVLDKDGRVVHFRRGPNDNRKATPDCHSHIHNYVMNLTHDKADAKTPWKAVKRHHFDIPAIEAKFHKRLAKNLRKIGHDAWVERKVVQYKSMQDVPEELRDRVKPSRKPRYVMSTLRIGGIAEETVELFSRRQDGIQANQRQREASGQKMTEGYKAKMSQIVRQPKADGTPVSKAELREEWKGRMSDKLRANLDDVMRKARQSANRSRWRAGLQRHLDFIRRFKVDRSGVTPQRDKGHELTR